MARVCNLSPVNLLSLRKCLLLSLDSWAQVGLSSYCSPLLSMSWDNRNKLVQLTWRHQVLQACSVGFIQNHLWCGIVQKIPWCQFTLQMTEISTRFLEIFLGRTRPLLACNIFEKINFYKPTWYNHHKNEILSNIGLYQSHSATTSDNGNIWALHLSSHDYCDMDQSCDNNKVHDVPCYHCVDISPVSVLGPLEVSTLSTGRRRGWCWWWSGAVTAE